MESWIKTTILFASLTALLISLGYVFGRYEGAIVSLIFSVVMNISTYWFSDKIALSASGAKPLESSQAPLIYQDIEEIAKQMNMPMPRLYTIESAQANAFATGRNPQNSAIAITKGLSNILTRQEIKAVLAHEMAHIKNRDVLIATIAAVLAGTIASLTNIFHLIGSGRDRRLNPLSIILILLAPIAAAIMQFAISRSREFAADETGSKCTKSPEELANALIKIHQSVKLAPMKVNPAFAPLYISNPMTGSFFNDLFSTHPSVDKRVQRLMSMKIN